MNIFKFPFIFISNLIGKCLKVIRDTFLRNEEMTDHLLGRVLKHCPKVKNLSLKGCKLITNAGFEAAKHSFESLGTIRIYISNFSCYNVDIITAPILVHGSNTAGVPSHTNSLSLAQSTTISRCNLFDLGLA